MVWRDRRVTLHDMHGITMEIPGPIEPCLIVLSCDVNDERVAVPTSDRPAHPGIGRRLWLAIHEDHACGAGKLVRHQDLFACLNDLERKSEICRSRYARQIAFRFR